jgi:hypothetical protein
MHGAKALAVPLKFGQQMVVENIQETGILKWNTRIIDDSYFQAEYKLPSFDIITSSNDAIGLFIRSLLKAAADLRSDLFSGTRGYSIDNYIDFDINWGLGSSSSLLSNLSFWINIDPILLYRKVFQGSGYDIYCARAESPIVYTLREGQPEVSSVKLHPGYNRGLFFVYSGRKQDSQESVKNFLSNQNIDKQIITRISHLTDLMVNASTLQNIMDVMHEHELVISSVLGVPPVKTRLFPEFNGEIKSLGAWGGDFMMVASPMNNNDVKSYFRNRNYPVVFEWDEIVHSKT